MGQIIMVVAADSTSQHAVNQALATIDNSENVFMLLNKAAKTGCRFLLWLWLPGRMTSHGSWRFSRTERRRFASASTRLPLAKLDPHMLGDDGRYGDRMRHRAGGAATGLVTPSIALETLTDNVNLQPAGTRKSGPRDAVDAVAGLQRQGSPHANLNWLRLRTASCCMRGQVPRNNYVYPFANVAGNAEAIEKFFYVEGASAFVSATVS